MNKLERLFLVVVFLCISLAAISWIGPEFFALLAMLELLIGVVIGMLIFLPNKMTRKYGKPTTHQDT